MRSVRLDSQLTQIKAELLLREESYNKRFASKGDAAGRRLSVSSAKAAHKEVMDWMLGGAETRVPKTSKRSAAAHGVLH